MMRKDIVLKNNKLLVKTNEEHNFRLQLLDAYRSVATYVCRILLLKCGMFW